MAWSVQSTNLKKNNLTNNYSFFCYSQKAYTVRSEQTTK